MLIHFKFLFLKYVPLKTQYKIPYILVQDNYLYWYKYIPPCLGIGMNNYSLGQFIRKCREQLSPGDVGLRSIGRRRTPGLRREELAQLCEVSVTWITWLEQGRPVSASLAMLERLAATLQLNSAKRQYLFTLASKVDPESKSDPADEPNAILSSVASIQQPAYILDRYWTALAWNSHAEALFSAWLGADAALTGRNLLKFMFYSDQARTLIDQWDNRAKRLVSEFRADCGNHVEEEELKTMIEALASKSEAFKAYWQDYSVMEREGGLRKFHHATLGDLAYVQTTFYPATRRDLKLVILLPADIEQVSSCKQT